MKKQLLSAAIATVLSSYAMAYQVEVGAAYGQGEIEAGGGSADTDLTGIRGEFHFDQVDTSKGPLAEAAFLDKSSFIDIAYLTEELDVNGADDIDTLSLGGRFVTGSNLIIEADYSETEVGDDEADTVGIGIGTYLNDTTDIVASYHTTDDDGSDVDILDVQLHGLNPMAQGATLAWDVGIGFVDADEDDGFSLNGGVTYYFTNMFGVGVSVDLLDVDEFEQDTLTLDVSYFPMPNLELAFSYFDQSTDAGGLDIDEDGFLLGAALRF